ncbi:hypothetical protein N0V83_007691 [Neocucurbitaria cava]|uniref:Uncharacterized protein n=1 Tax=Neocucurbitaria cava TaxID=798079 RepID=A0A9W9CKF7_9PLEO|nr:hypothetical protein N0V83_007691 [Neocucurbitaria cava]
MPPKKAAAATNGDAAGEVSGLLLLTQGRYVKPDEYEQLASAFGSSVSTGAIRNRISGLRVKQRDLYEKLGWELPEGGAGHSAKKPKGGKRGVSEDGGGAGGAEPETPSKKPRVKKAKKEAAAKKGEDSEEMEGGSAGGVKEEMIDEEYGGFAGGVKEEEIDEEA